MNDEKTWARTPAAPTNLPPDTQATSRMLGWIVMYLTFAPPIAVLLWRLALLTWAP